MLEQNRGGHVIVTSATAVYPHEQRAVASDAEPAGGAVNTFDFDAGEVISCACRTIGRGVLGLDAGVAPFERLSSSLVMLEDTRGARGLILYTKNKNKKETRQQQVERATNYRVNSTYSPLK